MKARMHKRGLPSIYQILFIIVMVGILCLINCALAQSASIVSQENDVHVYAVEDSTTLTQIGLDETGFNLLFSAWAADMVMDRNAELVPRRSFNTKPLLENLYNNENVSKSNRGLSFLIKVEPEPKLRLENWMLTPIRLLPKDGKSDKK